MIIEYNKLATQGKDVLLENLENLINLNLSEKN